MRVRLHNPKREVELTGPLSAGELCRRLGLNARRCSSSAVMNW